jgi:hypothetical protein
MSDKLLINTVSSQDKADQVDNLGVMQSVSTPEKSGKKRKVLKEIGVILLLALLVGGSFVGVRLVQQNQESRSQAGGVQVGGESCVSSLGILQKSQSTPGQAGDLGYKPMTSSQTDPASIYKPGEEVSFRVKVKNTTNGTLTNVPYKFKVDKVIEAPPGTPVDLGLDEATMWDIHAKFDSKQVKTFYDENLKFNINPGEEKYIYGKWIPTNDQCGIHQLDMILADAYPNNTCSPILAAGFVKVVGCVNQPPRGYIGAGSSCMEYGNSRTVYSTINDTDADLTKAEMFYRVKPAGSTSFGAWHQPAMYSSSFTAKKEHIQSANFLCSSATRGTVQIVVNGYDAKGNKCTGNPAVPTGWADCIGSVQYPDLIEFECANSCAITPTPTKKITPSPTPVACVKTCISETTSGWPDCNYCTDSSSNVCLQREVSCRLTAVQNLKIPIFQYPAPIRSTTYSDRMLWFNWAARQSTKISCGTACGMGAVPECCSPPGVSPTKTPTPTKKPELACKNITIDGNAQAVIRIGDTRKFTCSGTYPASGDKYARFRYNINNSGWIALGSPEINKFSESLTMTKAGDYKVECQVCLGTTCSPWKSL